MPKSTISASSSAQNRKRSLSPGFYRTLFFMVPLINGSKFAFYDFPQLFEGKLIHHFNVTAVEVVSLYSINSFTAPVVDLLMVYFIRRYGLGLCGLLSQTSVLLGVLASHFGIINSHYWLIMLGRLFFGLGMEIAGLVNSAVVEKWFQEKDITTAIACNRVYFRVFLMAVAYSFPLLYTECGGFGPVMIGFEIIATLSLMGGLFYYYVEKNYETPKALDQGLDASFEEARIEDFSFEADFDAKNEPLMIKEAVGKDEGADADLECSFMSANNMSFDVDVPVYEVAPKAEKDEEVGLPDEEEAEMLGIAEKESIMTPGIASRKQSLKKGDSPEDLFPDLENDSRGFEYANGPLDDDNTPNRGPYNNLPGPQGPIPTEAPGGENQQDRRGRDNIPHQEITAQPRQGSNTPRTDQIVREEENYNNAQNTNWNLKTNHQPGAAEELLKEATPHLNLHDDVDSLSLGSQNNEKKTEFGMRHLTVLPAVVWALIGLITISGACYYQLTGVGTDMMQKRYSMTYREAKNVMTVFPLISLVTIIIILPCMRRMGSKPIFFITGSSLYFVSHVIFALLPSENPGVLLYLPIILINFGNSMIFSLADASVLLISPSKAVTFCAALVAIGYNSSSIFLSPVTGYLSKARTVEAYQNCLYLFMGVSLVSLSFSVWIYCLDVGRMGGLLHKKDDDPALREHKKKVNEDLEVFLGNFEGTSVADSRSSASSDPDLGLPE